MPRAQQTAILNLLQQAEEDERKAKEEAAAKQVVEEFEKKFGSQSKEELSKSTNLIDQIAHEASKVNESSDAVQRYLGTLTANIEAEVSGATNYIAEMQKGTIKANHRDMAEVYRILSIVEAQIGAIKDKAKDFIANDATAPSSFIVGTNEFEVKKGAPTTMFDSAR